jgi:diguanylate cyclase (GGDEF)-like protein/PAS domain S-box-containing protein
MTSLKPKYFDVFLALLVLYVVLIIGLWGTELEKFEHLHLGLDTSNAILSLLLAVFLLGERHTLQPNVRNYLVIGFGFAAGTELLHALIGIEWSGGFAWIQEYSHTIRPATWPPSTYVLPLSLAWIYWLMRHQAVLSPARFATGMAVLTIGLFALSFYLPRYVDTGILGIQRPTQIPLLFLWGAVIVVFWQKRHEHRLFEGLALMGVFLLLSDLCMLYSTSPHEKFTMMAHAGKFIAYVLLHTIQMRVAAEDGRARDAAEASLLQEKERLKFTLEELKYQKFALDQHAIVTTTDASGTITNVNKKLCDISGYSQYELIGKNHRVFNSGTHSVDFFREMYETITRGQVWHGEICNRSKNGDLYWLDTTIVPYLDSAGKVTQYIAMRSNITERKQADAQIHRLAFYDPLTNLPNRRLLNDRLGQAVAATKRNGHFGALIFIDLDHFKPLNDEHGHAVGDLLLVEVARRIVASIREADTIARFGGDEFVLLLSELTDDQAESATQASIVAEKIRGVLAEPYFLTPQSEDESKIVTVEHHCTSSIGVAIFSNQEVTPEEIIVQADIAMYQAKTDGRNTIYFYQPTE